MTTIEIHLPIRTVSEANQSGFEHWGAKARRVKSQRETVYYALFEYRYELPGFDRYIVTLTRIAPRNLDEHDNLPRSMKAITDQIAKMIGIDDGSERIEWKYAQEKGKPKEYAVKIKIEERR